MLHCALIHKKIQCFKKILIHESLEYKGLLLIQMAGVIVSRLSSDGFEEFWLTSSVRSSPALKVEKYSSCCIRSSENHARTLHPSLTFLLDDHSSGLLAAAKARCTLLAII